MAITGLMLFGFVVGHMAGNLKAFQGAEAFNHYAEGIRDFGSPFIPHEGALWIARLGLLLAAGLHIWAATALTLVNRRARPQNYRRRQGVQLDYASRTMRYSGYILFAYIVYHLMHLTVGNAHPDFIAGDAYHNLTSGLSKWPVALAYVVAVLLLGTHLYHGLWSFFQTLGLRHPSIDRLRRPFAVLFAVMVTVGFLLVPIGVLTGVLS